MAYSNQINHHLTANTSGEAEQIFKPISGYEGESLVSIEDACKSLESILGPELTQNITIAKSSSTKLEYDLTQDEAAVIYLYTMDWDKRENSLHMVLNETLCMADRTKLLPWFKYLKLFLTGLFKLPPTKYQTVWQDVPGDLSAAYTRGKEFTWWGLSSCTSVDMLQSPTGMGNSRPRTIFSIEAKNGKSIKDYSHYKHDDEIFLLPGGYFRVVDQFSPAKDLHVVYLREIEPPHPMLVLPLDLSELKNNQPETAVPRSLFSGKILEIVYSNTFTALKIFSKEMFYNRVEDICKRNRLARAVEIIQFPVILGKVTLFELCFSRLALMNGSMLNIVQYPSACIMIQ